MTTPEAGLPAPSPTQIICVVDDDLSMRTAIVRMLKSIGYSATSFSSAEEFLAFEHKAATACLILDVRMKGMSGLELQTALLTAGITISIVFISAHADLEAQRRALQAGAIGFLPKPFRSEDFLSCLEIALRQAD